MRCFVNFSGSDMSNSLEERLKTHSNAFDGLLSLIPAKYYYDDATQDQWQQKKQDKEQLKQHKRDKLDPNNSDSEHTSTAKEVMDKKAKKAKPVQLPQKLTPIVDDDSDEEIEIPDMEVDASEEEEEQEEPIQEPVQASKPEEPVNIEDSIQVVFDDEGNEINPTTTQPAKKEKKKKELSEDEKKQKQENLKKLREKLASKISNLREKRKAPGSKANGAPKSREQILEERKRKAEQKKQEKLKRKHEEVESSDDSDNDEEDEESTAANSVVFGNITFNDGTRVTSDLSKIRSTSEKKKGKGPANNDIKAHLLKLEKKKQKLARLSPAEQAAELEKEKWQRLMNQAEGVKVKDDEKLLKKALKRKDRKKLKSEIEWKDRKRIILDTIAAKIKKRDENLKTRRENKGKKSKNQVRLKKFSGIVNKTASNPKAKKRAGFEGSAKSKSKK